MTIVDRCWYAAEANNNTRATWMQIEGGTEQNGRFIVQDSKKLDARE
jgi:hypothetical protein